MPGGRGGRLGDVPGLRRLRDVGSKISGALAGPRDEVAKPAAAAPTRHPDTAPAPAPADQTADSSPPTQEEHVQTVDSVPPDAPDGAAPAGAAVPVDVRPSEPDAVCAAAVELARAVAVEVAGDAVGDHLGVEAEPAAEGGAAVTHSFATREAGYVGWRWAVTVARAAGSDEVTVDEVVLLPGGGALLAPAWVPWSERLQPGDLGPGDLLPPPDDDPRLVPSYADVDADELLFDLHRELGLGRPRVLSLDGRADAAERWYDGPGGPDAPIAKQAPGRCADCGFLVPLAGSLGRGFGVCGNGMAPDDGRVVALQHGCGAHSETVTTSAHANITSLAVEHEALEVVDIASLPDAESTDEIEVVDVASLPDPDPEPERVTADDDAAPVES